MGPGSWTTFCPGAWPERGVADTGMNCEDPGVCAWEGSLVASKGPGLLRQLTLAVFWDRGRQQLKAVVEELQWKTPKCRKAGREWLGKGRISFLL